MSLTKQNPSRGKGLGQRLPFRIASPRSFPSTEISKIPRTNAGFLARFSSQTAITPRGSSHKHAVPSSALRTQYQVPALSARLLGYLLTVNMKPETWNSKPGSLTFPASSLTILSALSRHRPNRPNLPPHQHFRPKFKNQKTSNHSLTPLSPASTSPATYRADPFPLSVRVKRPVCRGTTSAQQSSRAARHR